MIKVTLFDRQKRVLQDLLPNLPQTFGGTAIGVRMTGQNSEIIKRESQDFTTSRIWKRKKHE